MTRPQLSPFRSATWDRLFSPTIAHRGLWSPNGAPENSLAAFEAACQADYGIELDVQLSKDGQAMVFHDEHLARMAGAAARLDEKTAAELGALRLKGSGEWIPTLSEVLDRVAGRALILIEIKSLPGEEGPLDRAVAQAIADYEGPRAVIGFNPLSHAWWADHEPNTLRGLNMQKGQLSDDQLESFSQASITLAKPHFLALGVDMLPSDLADRRRAEGYPIVAWTVRSEAQWSGFKAHCDNLIFEGFAP